LFKGYEPVAKWLAERKPDVLVFFYNDHATSFFFDVYPTFALGVSSLFEIADEGAGKRPLPPIKGHPQLAAHMAESLINDEFDLTLFQDRPLDHGCHSPLPLLWPHKPDWPGCVVPIEINVLQYPLPTARRCYKLGQAVRRAVESYREDLRVAVIGTGGLSHQLTGPNFGTVYPEWDRKFLQLLEEDPQRLAGYSIEQFARLGGEHSIEVVQWLAMRAALPPAAVTELRFYYPYGLMGYGIAGFRGPESGARAVVET
jgi:Catalytic LigB subunit of aromatic ring-opening dioxygenase